MTFKQKKAFISYAQNAEDVVLRRVLSNVSNGFYVDLGAGHPTLDSVTKAFYESGWSGVNLEPDDRLFEILDKERVSDINLSACASNEEGPIQFWEVETLGWSTSSSLINSQLPTDQEVRSQLKKSFNLEQIMELAPSEIHFLKIDIEGGEIELLAGAQFNKVRPWIIVVESIQPRSDQSNHKKLVKILAAKNYKFTYFDGLNDFYVSNDHPQLQVGSLWYPACARDQFVRYSDILLVKELVQSKNATAVLEELSNNLQQLQKEKEHLQEQYLDISAANSAKDVIIDDLHATVENTNYQKSALLSQNKILEDDVRAAQRSSIELKMELSVTQSELLAIKNSNIWVISKPYRTLNWHFSRLSSRVEVVWHQEKSFVKFSIRGIRSILRRINLPDLSAKNNALRSEKIDIGITKHMQMKGSKNLGRNPSSVGRKETTVVSSFRRSLYIFVGSTAQVNSNTGVQRVTRSFVKTLIELEKDLVLVKIDTAIRRIVTLSESEYENFCSPILPIQELNSYFPNRHEQVDHAVENGILIVPEVPYLNQVDPLICDVLTSYCNSNYLSVISIYYDSIPLTSPGYESSFRAHESYLRFLSNSSHISCISEHSRKELENLLNRSEYNPLNLTPNLSTQHLPVPSQLVNVQAVKLDELSGKTFVLCVGTVEPRKNQQRIVNAYENIFRGQSDAPTLVIVGNVRQDVSFWVTESNSDLVLWKSGLNDAQLAWLYQNCAFTIFLSLEEGFGYPVLESQFFGKLCVVSNHGSMREIATSGGCVLVEDPLDINQIEEKIRLAFSKVDLKESTISRKFTDWHEYVTEFLSKMEEGLSKGFAEFQILYWVDHTVTFESNTGIQRVVRQLAKSLINSGIDVVPIKWNIASHDFDVPNSAELSHLEKWNGPMMTNFNQHLDLNSAKTKFLVIPELTTYSPDEHFLRHIIQHAKNLGIHVVTIFFDALPLKLQESYSSAAGAKHSKYMADLLDSDLVFTISSSAYEDLVDFILESKADCQSALTKLVQLDLPASLASGRGGMIERRPSSKSLQGKRKILCVGTLEPRKNHTRLIEAFASLSNDGKVENTELIIVGRNADPSISERVLEFSKKHSITWLSEVTDSDLVDLYRDCDFTVFPSIAEGFGLPIIESLSFGKPVICGTGSSFDQIASKGGCVQVNVQDSNDLANAMLNLLSNNDKYKSLLLEIENIYFDTWEDYSGNFVRKLLSLKKRKVKHG